MAFSKKAASFAKQNLPGWAQDRLRAWAIRPGLRARYRFSFKDAPEATPSPFPFAVDKANLLEELGAKYDPSKRKHNYLAYYWLHFRDVRHQVKNVLEIGVQTDRSIRMWEDVLPERHHLRCRHRSRVQAVSRADVGGFSSETRATEGF